jgi:4-amino-4-deoxy-L-arabinose transferase-like glycosyltransferase
MDKFKQLLFTHRHALSFWILVLIRGYFNAVLPLMDKTEARYGEIARLMSETGNWITPQIDYGLPFWAKPPLSTWASALSISILAVLNFLFDFLISSSWWAWHFLFEDTPRAMFSLIIYLV